MNIVRLLDIDLIRQALWKDSLYKNVCQIDSLSDWIPDMGLCHWYIGYEDNKLVGLIMLKIETSALASFHGGIYKEFRGQALNYLKGALEEFRRIYGCKFMTTVPSTNKLAQRLDLRLGLKEIGRIKNGYKDADMIIYSEEE